MNLARRIGVMAWRDFTYWKAQTMVSRTIDCTIRQGTDGAIEPIRVEFPEDEFATLAEFMRHVETLFASSALDNLQLQCQVTLDREKGLSFSGTLPNDDVVAVLLHRMRPFVLIKEPTCLIKICNSLSRYITHDGFRNAIKGIKDEFTGKNFQKQLTIDVNGAVLNTDAMFNKWLNACEYHHCDDAQKVLDQFKAVLPEAWQRAIFISMMLDKAKQVGNTSIIVRWLNRTDKEPLTI